MSQIKNPLKVGDPYYCLGHRRQVLAIDGEQIKVSAAPGHNCHWRHWRNGLVDPNVIDRVLAESRSVT